MLLVEAIPCFCQMKHYDCLISFVFIKEKYQIYRSVKTNIICLNESNTLNEKLIEKKSFAQKTTNE